MLLGKYWLFSRLGCSAGLIIKCRLRGGGDGGARGAAAPQRIVSWQADIAVLIGASDHWITEILSPLFCLPSRGARSTYGTSLWNTYRKNDI